MARYNVRDLLGHWVKPRSAEGQMCPHACCRGYRVHPANMPVILPNKLLHRASDDDLAEHWDRVGNNSRARAQILHEMERRDRAAERRDATQARRQARWAESREARAAYRAAGQMERESERERIYLEAEAYTRGNWTNTRGTAVGISDREILTGREQVFQRYASEEAREYFRHHPRPTTAYFRGRDTRIAYSDPGRRRRVA